MNQKKFFIYAALLVVAGLACGYALAAGLQDDAVAPPVTPQQVHAPAIPAQVQFAGRDIDLRRHDLRERFDRELLTFTYMHGTTYQIIKRANRYFPSLSQYCTSRVYQMTSSIWPWWRVISIRAWCRRWGRWASGSLWTTRPGNAGLK